jgi:PqqD family protein of HPr-rel-A system
MKWRLHPAQSLRLSIWEDEAVIYNDCSGDTHLISAAAADLLLQLQQASSEEPELIAACAAAWLIPAEDHEFAAQMHTLLADLSRLSLIEQIPS